MRFVLAFLASLFIGGGLDSSQPAMAGNSERTERAGVMLAATFT